MREKAKRRELLPSEYYRTRGGKRKKKGFVYEMAHNAWLYILVLPAVLYTLLFKYLPMAGIVIAFQDYNPTRASSAAASSASRISSSSFGARSGSPSPSTPCG